MVESAIDVVLGEAGGSDVSVHLENTESRRPLVDDSGESWSDSVS